MSKAITFPLKSRMLLVSLTLFVSGCGVESSLRPAVVSGSDSSIGDGLFSVLVSPGEGSMCRNSSCRIYYRMPELGREAMVVVNNFDSGTFPSGKVVDLGTWSDSVRIAIPDSDVPMAYVDIYGNSAP